MNKVKKSHIGVLLIVLALLFSALWYTAPRTTEDLFSDFCWDEIICVDGRYDRHEENDHPAKAPLCIQGISESIPIDTETGQALLALLRDVEYRRSLGNLLPAKGRSYGFLQPGDLEVETTFYVEGTPGYLRVCFYYDRMILSTGESKEYTCSATGQEILAQKMLSLLQPYATEAAIN